VHEPYGALDVLGVPKQWPIGPKNWKSKVTLLANLLPSLEHRPAQVAYLELHIGVACDDKIRKSYPCAALKRFTHPGTAECDYNKLVARFFLLFLFALAQGPLRQTSQGDAGSRK